MAKTVRPLVLMATATHRIVELRQGLYMAGSSEFTLSSLNCPDVDWHNVQERAEEVDKAYQCSLLLNPPLAELKLVASAFFHDPGFTD